MKSSWLSIYLLAPGIAWLVAQFTKVGLASFRPGSSKEDRNFFKFKSGNMPSSHSAITVALLVVILAQEGINSPVFGLAFVMTAIVIYDALNVRRTVGEQGNAIKQLLQAAKQNASFHVAKGHTVTEVVAGAVLGLLVGLILLQIL